MKQYTERMILLISENLASYRSENNFVGPSI